MEETVPTLTAAADVRDRVRDAADDLPDAMKQADLGGLRDVVRDGMAKLPRVDLSAVEVPEIDVASLPGVDRVLGRRRRDDRRRLMATVAGAVLLAGVLLTFLPQVRAAIAEGIGGIRSALGLGEPSMPGSWSGMESGGSTAGMSDMTASALTSSTSAGGTVPAPGSSRGSGSTSQTISHPATTVDETGKTQRGASSGTTYGTEPHPDEEGLSGLHKAPKGAPASPPTGSNQGTGRTD
jgi:hypothetical protein